MNRALAAALLGVAVVAGSASARPSVQSAPSRSHILFVSERDGDSEIYAVNADGSRLSQLTRNRIDDDGVTVSPNGRRIAFSCSYSLCLMNANGTRKTRVRLREFYGFATWSPNSSKIAYQASGGAFVADVNGKNRRRLSSGAVGVVDWSPDSRYVLLQKTTEPEPGLEEVIFIVVPVAGGPAVRIAGGEAQDPDWSPASSEIALHIRGNTFDRPARVRIYDHATGQSRDVLTQWQIRGLAWSPNGKYLAVNGDPRDDFQELMQVLELRPDTRLVATAPDPSYGFSWSPDSRRLVFPRGDSRLTALAVPGGEVRALKGQLGLWSPDGTEIAYSTRGGLSTVRVTTNRVRSVVAGRGSIVAWVRGPVPAGAPASTPLPAFERAAPTELRLRGRVTEISASGTRVAAAVDWARLDCMHVVVWTAGTSGVARSEPRYPCTRDPDQSPPLTALLLRGSRAYWTHKWVCSPERCERRTFRGVVRGLRRMTVRTGFQSFLHQEAEEPPLPWEREPTPLRNSPRRLYGITMYVRGRAIHVGQKVVWPPGRGRVDAWMTSAGLFYSFNVGGPWPGRVRFVPMRELR